MNVTPVFRISYPFLIRLFTVAPVVFLAFCIITLGVDVPFLDEWEIAALLTAKEGISFHALWQLHNEHRTFFLKLLILLLSHFSKWNICYEMAVSFIFVLAIFLIIFLEIRRLEKFSSRAVPLLIWPVISLLLFSIASYGNWLWGFQVGFITAHLCIVLGFSALAQWTHTSSKEAFAIALVCGILATYTTAHGLTYWPVGILAILIAPKPRTKYLFTWCIVFALTMAIYFYKYTKAPHTGELGHLFFQNPAQFIGLLAVYMLGFLGAPLKWMDAFIAVIIGTAGLLAFIWVCIHNRRKNWLTYSFFYLISIYTIMTALLIGFGRVEFGVTQALTPRYVITGSLFWIGLIVLMSDSVSLSCAHRKKWYMATAVIGILSILTASYAMPSAKQFSSILSTARVHIIEHYPDTLDDKILSTIYPADPERVKSLLKGLAEKKLSLFRE